MILYVSELSKAKSVWEDTSRPFSNFRERRGEVLTYGMEADLDHQAYCVETMLRAWLERNPHWGFDMRAEHELGELRDCRERVTALELCAISLEQAAQKEIGVRIMKLFGTQ